MGTTKIITTMILSNLITALKVDPNLLCEITYDINQMNDTVKEIMDNAELWKEQSSLSLEDQIGTYNQKPIFLTEGSNLHENLKDCTSKKGHLIEPQGNNDIKRIREILKTEKVMAIFIGVELKFGILTWPTTGTAINIDGFTNLKTIVEKDNYIGVVKLQLWNAAFSNEMLSFYEIPGDLPEGLSGVCVMKMDQLIAESDKFNRYVAYEMDNLVNSDPKLEDLRNEVIELSSSNTTKQEENCINTSIEPVRDMEIIAPKAPKDIQSLTNLKKQFWKFTKKVKTVKDALKTTVKMLKEADEVNPDIITVGSLKNFFNNFDITNSGYQFILGLFMSIGTFISSTIYCCKKYIQRKRKPGRRIEIYDKEENIPLSRRNYNNRATGTKKNKITELFRRNN